MSLQGRIASPKSQFEVTPSKAIAGLVLFSLAIAFSKSAFDGTKLENVANSHPLNHVATNATSRQHFDQPVQDLLKSLEAATTAAVSRPRPGESGRIPTTVEFNPRDQRQWEDKNPCTSRKELKLRYERRTSGEHVDLPPELQVVMDEYSKLHRACIQAAGDLTTLFLSKNPETGCKFLVAEAGNGLGNRIMWMVSNLMYAILTQRVLLVDPRSMIPSLMCEPFLGSSWAAPKEFPLADLRPDLWQTTNEFLATMDNLKVHEKKNGTNAILVNAARADDDWGPTSRFYCPTEQSNYAKVRWITLGGCLYFLPELFAIPTFQRVLESIFKDMNPLTHLLRYSMLPRDFIWARIRRVEEVYLGNRKQMVGVHIRYRDGYNDYKTHHRIVNSNVKDCLEENGILPKISSSSPWKLFKSSPKPSHGIVVLFISSLYDSLFDDFKIIYPQDKVMSKISPISKEAVSLVHLSSEGQQLPGFEIDSQALVEILCLSFSDVLLTSPMSTFSQVAHAYGSLQPWIINFQEPNAQAEMHIPACQKGKSTDGCYQGGGLFYFCPHDPSVDKAQITKHVPSLKLCEDGSAGVQFIPN